MNFPASLRLACLAAISSLALTAHAESLPSSASSAGSASSGSVSASLHESSDSSSKDEKRADGDYRIIFHAIGSNAERLDRPIQIFLPLRLTQRQAFTQGSFINLDHMHAGFFQIQYFSTNRQRQLFA